MRTVIADAPWTFNIELDPPADLNSVQWTLRGNDGSLMGSYIDQAVSNPSMANRVSIAIPGAAHAKTTGVGLSENRFLTTLWTSNGATYSITQGYLLTDFMPIMVTPDHVRAVCGLTPPEFRDDEMDIIAAAREVSADVTSAVFNAALIAGDESTSLINSLIAYRTVLDLAPSLQLRITSLMSEAETKFQRGGSLSVKELTSNLRGAYDAVRTALTGTAPTVPTIFTLTSRPVSPWVGPLLATPVLTDAYFPWGAPWLPYQTL